jgi:GNAT superfamily N-acetyltransferase
MDIQRLLPDDWQVFRALRLEALADAPQALTGSLADEEKLAEAAWRDQIARRNLLVAIVDGMPAGIAGGQLDEEGAELVSLWVHPRARGQGVADGLVKSVVSWARTQRRRQIKTWAALGNAAADRLYANHGFVATGKTRPIDPKDPNRLERELVRPAG